MATCSISGKTVTVTYVTAGTATITVKASETDKYTEASKQVSVACARSATTLSASTSNLTIYGNNYNGSTFTVSYTGDGSLSVASTNTSIATATISGGTITVSYVAPGSCTVTISASQGTRYNSTSVAVSISCTRTSLTIPSLSGTSFACSGNWVAPTVYNYNSSLENQGGSTGTNTVGSYTISWSLKDTNRYCWSDGSTGTKSASWSTYASGTVTWYTTAGGNCPACTWTANYGRWNSYTYSNRPSTTTWVGSSRYGGYVYWGYSGKFTNPCLIGLSQYVSGNVTEYRATVNITGDYPVNGATYTTY